MNFKNIFKKYIDAIYKVSSVEQGYFYWINKLLDISMDLFEYTGLPETLPHEEIELRLLKFGYCGILKHPTEGIIACNSSLFDYDIYGRYNRVNFYNPYKNFNASGFYPGNKKIGEECIVIYNNSVEKYLNQPVQGTDVFFQCICRYARMLADIESTTNNEIILTRQPFMPVAGNQQTKDSVLAVFRALKKGEIEIPIDNDFLKDLKTLKNQEVSSGHITELIDARKSLIKQFLSEIGVYSTDDKMERLIVSEVEQENKNVKIFLYSMLKSRQIGIYNFNKFFGLDAKVFLRKELFDKTELYERDKNVSEGGEFNENL